MAAMVCAALSACLLCGRALPGVPNLAKAFLSRDDHVVENHEIGVR